VSLAALADELVSYEPTLPRWSLKAFCGDHAKQWEFATSPSMRRHLQCARQSGKSWIVDGLVADRAQLTPNSLHFVLGLNGVAVRMNNWVPIWKRTLDKYRVERRDNQQMMLSEFPNGARVIFTGTDDLRHVRNFLGNRLPKGSTFVIDESQDQPEDTMRYLLDQVLVPMMTPDTLLIEAGVHPDMPAGRFYRDASDASWDHFGWGRFDNPHTPEARTTLANHLRDHQLTEADLEFDPEHPPEGGKLSIVLQILRDWFNRGVYDPSARTYWYRESVNAYDPVTPAWATSFVSPPGFGPVRFAEPWPGVDTFAVAIDPGGSDPFGLQVIGWGRTHRRIQHLVDWVAPRGAKLSWGDVMRTLGVLVARRYPTVLWRYDTTSDTELDTFGNEYGVPVIRAAKKADRDGQIRRNNDLLSDGTLAVMRNSNLATDYISAQLVDGAWGAYHPTASECVRYAVGDFWETRPAPVPPPRAMDPLDREAARMAEQLKRGGRRFPGRGDR